MSAVKQKRGELMVLIPDNYAFVGKTCNCCAKAAARSVDALGNRIGELLFSFSWAEYANYSRNAGYAPH
jgi:hypothetical protein